MVGAHIAHDCQVGQGVIMANNATLAGHVTVGDHAVLGGLCAVHQFVRVGAYAMVGGMTGVEQDVIPFGSVMGNRAYLAGLNHIALKRHGFSKESIQALRRTYKRLYDAVDTVPIAEKLESLPDELASDVAVARLITFMTAKSQRGLCRPPMYERNAPEPEMAATG